MSERPQTGLRRGDDGRFTTWCRVCPKRSWRQLSPEERTGGWFDTKEEALEQAKRHRRSDAHQETVIRLASEQPTEEEKVLARIFGEQERTPCERCGTWHSPKIGCLKAARIRGKEGA